jgi:hypothetical protein
VTRPRSTDDDALSGAGVHEIVVMPPDCESVTLSPTSCGRRGPLPPHTPALQVSLIVQALASSQGVPSGFAGLEQAPLPASQVPAS